MSYAMFLFNVIKELCKTSGNDSFEGHIYSTDDDVYVLSAFCRNGHMCPKYWQRVKIVYMYVYDVAKIYAAIKKYIYIFLQKPLEIEICSPINSSNVECDNCAPFQTTRQQFLWSILYNGLYFFL